MLEDLFVGADSPIKGQVDTFADLPATAELGDLFVVKTTTGVIGINRKLKGLYRWDGAAWVFADGIEANKVIYNNADSSLTSGTVKAAIDELDTKRQDASNLTSGTIAEARLPTINADNTTISNLEVDNLKAGVLDTDLTAVSANDNTLASAKAIKAYADATGITSAEKTKLGHISVTQAVDLDTMESKLDGIESGAIDAKNSFTQNDNQYIATDTVKARDSSGLTLTESGGTGIFIEHSTGNVGVKTTSPSAPLDVNGALLAGGGSSGPSLSYQNQAQGVSFSGLNANVHSTLAMASNLYIDSSNALKTANTHSTMSGAAIVIPGNGVTNQNALEFYTNAVGSVTAGGAYGGSLRMIIKADGTVQLYGNAVIDGSLSVGNLSQGNVYIGNASNESEQRALTLNDTTGTLAENRLPTINADNTTITNLEVDNLKTGVLDTDLASVSASDNTIPSAKATKAYADSLPGATNLSLSSGDLSVFTSGNNTIELTANTGSNSESLEIKGDATEGALVGVNTNFNNRPMSMCTKHGSSSYGVDHAIAAVLNDTTDSSNGLYGCYGIYMGSDFANGHGWIQTGRSDSTNSALNGNQYNLLLQPQAGNVGIGTTSATAKLTVNGSVSKTSGSFDIPHPDPEKKDTHRLRHYFVETPSAGGNIYKYQLECKQGDNYIDLPDYFQHLNKDSLVWANPFKHFGRAWGEVIADGKQAKIVCEQDGVYNILIFGDRKDKIAMDDFTKYGVEYKVNSTKETTTNDT